MQRVLESSKDMVLLEVLSCLESSDHFQHQWPTCISVIVVPFFFLPPFERSPS